MHKLLLILLALAVPVSGQERRAMTTDDGLDMVRAGDAIISPDGSWVLFSRSELDWEENERETIRHNCFCSLPQEGKLLN